MNQNCSSCALYLVLDSERSSASQAQEFLENAFFLIVPAFLVDKPAGNEFFSVEKFKL
jgi:hypothetical protein